MKRGEIRFVQIPNHVGSEMAKDRPAIIVSNDTLNEVLDVVTVVYLSSAEQRYEIPEHTTIRSSSRLSTSICEQISCVDVSRVSNYCLGVCSDAEMQQLDIAIACALGIDPGAQRVSNKNDSESNGEEIIQLRNELEVYKNLYDSLLNRLMK